MTDSLKRYLYDELRIKTSNLINDFDNLCKKYDINYVCLFSYGDTPNPIVIKTIFKLKINNKNPSMMSFVDDFGELNNRYDCLESIGILKHVKIFKEDNLSIELKINHNVIK